ncbi:MAG: spore maturation protein [Deltaproteobacteria bacterium]|nr:spore maturation protein [Deltaproteobacteria bacterium]MBW2362390.1 spore maturation protein [Deltaproteobacteria bacterium]
MLNWIWLALMLGGVIYAAFAGDVEVVKQTASGEVVELQSRVQAVSTQMLESAKSAIMLVISLTGIMVFVLGLMRIGKDAGMMRWIALRLAPLTRRLFPDVPPDHPAMSAMVMSFTANIFGLANAATPFGLKAMSELSKLNPIRGVASNSMILFICITTSSITLMPPTGTVGVRAAANSADPFAIWIPTLIATLCSTAAAVATFYLLRDRARFAARPLADADLPAAEQEIFDTPEADEVLGGADRGPLGTGRKLFIAVALLALATGLVRAVLNELPSHTAMETFNTVAKAWLFPLLVSAMLLVGVGGRVRLYESAIEGAREGLEVVVRITPYLVAILVAVGMFRASGALDLVIGLLDPLTSRIGIPGEVLPMALLRPLSGTGAFGVMAEILHTHGPDSFVGMLASTLQGSTDTTFYVLTLYAGAAGIRDVRFALIACLAGDLAGLLGATAACHFFFG